MRIETNVIGCLILESELYDQYAGQLVPDMFSDDVRPYFHAFLECHEAGQVDLLLLLGKVPKEKQVFTADQMLRWVAPAETINFSSYVDSLVQDYLRGFVANIATHAVSELANGADYVTALSKLEQARDVIESINIQQQRQHISNSTARLQELFERAQSAQGVAGIDTGFYRLNKNLGGWHKSSMTILAGRPGMGKTTVAVNLLMNVAAQNVPVGFISCEMSEEQIGVIMVSIISGIATDRLLSPNLSTEEKDLRDRAVARLNQLPIFITDRANTLNEIISTIRKWSMTENVEFVAIDYLQLISADGGFNRNDEIEKMTRRLKRASGAGYANVSLLVLSQLSRRVDDRKDKKPILSDLRDSGAIEQDADVVIFLYRDSYYDINSGDESMIVMIEKNRMFGTRGDMKNFYVQGRLLIHENSMGEPEKTPASRLQKDIR